MTCPHAKERSRKEARGVLALIVGLRMFTEECAGKYADPCAVTEMGVAEMFSAARAMLNYAPDTLDRGALDSHLAELMQQWHINPDTLEWEGK